MKTQEKVKQELKWVTIHTLKTANEVRRAVNNFEALLEACKTVSYGLRTGASEKPLKNILDKAIQQAESEG